MRNLDLNAYKNMLLQHRCQKKKFDKFLFENDV